MFKREPLFSETESGNGGGGNRRIAYGVTSSSGNGNRKLRPYKGWKRGRGRSTTTPSPYTLNAEIYEVHPGSRLRITTEKQQLIGQQRQQPIRQLQPFPTYDDDYEEAVTERLVHSSYFYHR